MKLFRDVPLGESSPPFIPCHRGSRSAQLGGSCFIRMPLIPFYRRRFYQIHEDALWRGVTVWSVLFALDHMRGGIALRIMLGENLWQRFAWQIATSP